MESPAPSRSAWSTAGLRSAVCCLVVVVCVAQAWAVVFALRIGPVIASLDAGAGRGVHEGDLLAVPLVCAGLLLFLLGAHPSAHERQRPARVL